MNEDLSDVVPPALYKDGERVLGRWRGGVNDTTIENLSLGQYAVQHKEWQWFGFTDGRFFLGLAVGQLHYVSTAFVFALDSSTRQSAKVAVEMPLGAFTHVAEGLADREHCTSFESALASAVTVRICYKDGHTTVECRGQLNSSSAIEGRFDITHGKDDTFGMAFPAADRSRYTHKVAAWSAQGSLEWGGVKRAITSNGLAMADFSGGLFPRHTLWFWVCFSANVRGHRIGVHLSEGLYNSARGRNLEAIVWLDGKLHEVSASLRWLGSIGTKNLWGFGKPVRVVQSAIDGGSALSLYYTPLGSIHVNKHLYVIDADFVRRPIVACASRLTPPSQHHTFGVYTGHVTIEGEKYVITGAPGVFEDHDAWW